VFKGQDFTLTDALLAIDRPVIGRVDNEASKAPIPQLNLELVGVEVATLTGGPGNNLFDARDFSGTVKLFGSPTAPNPGVRFEFNDDVFIVGGKNNEIVSGASDDRIAIKFRPDEAMTVKVTDGGGIGDLLDFSLCDFSGTEGVTVDLNQVNKAPQQLIPTAGGTQITLTLLAEPNGRFEFLWGSKDNDKLIGNNVPDVLLPDVIYGDAGDDRIEGGAGVNYVFGGPGKDDVISVAEGTDLRPSRANDDRSPFIGLSDPIPAPLPAGTSAAKATVARSHEASPSATPREAASGIPAFLTSFDRFEDAPKTTLDSLFLSRSFPEAVVKAVANSILPEVPELV
jgi:Ca2+-binding RTX toxin-like protein